MKPWTLGTCVIVMVWSYTGRHIHGSICNWFLSYKRLD